MTPERKRATVAFTGDQWWGDHEWQWLEWLALAITLKGYLSTLAPTRFAGSDEEWAVKMGAAIFTVSDSLARLHGRRTGLLGTLGF